MAPGNKIRVVFWWDNMGRSQWANEEETEWMYIDVMMIHRTCFGFCNIGGVLHRTC